MTSARGDDLLARVEDAGLNASAPRQQRWLDGWLVRFSPGKAKRARCIQAVADGREPIAARLQRCLPIYAEAGLHPYLRVTPFSKPAGLDDELARLGWQRLDETRVMVAPDLGALLSNAPSAPGAELRIEPSDPVAFVDWIGSARGSTAVEREAHRERVAGSPVPYRALLGWNGDARAVAGGQVAIEAELAGLYDVATLEEVRGRGHGSAVCLALLQLAHQAGARAAYLQVDAANDAAIRLYRKLGFVDGYTYHYRTPARS